MPSNGKDLILVAKIVEDGIKRDDVIEIMDIGIYTPKNQQLLVCYESSVRVVSPPLPTTDRNRTPPFPSPQKTRPHPPLTTPYNASTPHH